MKKTLSVLFAVLLMVSLVACGEQNTGSEENSASQAPAVSASLSSAPAEEPASDAIPESAHDAASSESVKPGGTLVAYFSWSGNTRRMAELIAQETGGNLFEIATAVPYTDDYNELLDIAQQEQSEEARPELNGQVENWDSYDTVFVGYPNWWSDAPMAVYTFLESYDFTGKTLIPFNTSASGGFGRSLAGMEESAVGATMLEGLALTESELEDEQAHITSWLEELALNR
ncbi:flavodoxin [Subdoligranulum variabile]|uniref:Flavodoxin-like domain-containing protein n=1 Tax=Subdoligranulum variabile DSM 15176 TaxID=411471 RepID=D1PKH4_9FIRM|nr:flavodoxin [Subdoligranulum variabile]EFB76482.1 hypothetical protein SUBVAR_04850 [Subdoligranulum variabile DSM 15176]UWP68270.1 flavodoxin [Subdoligranulum variabile]